MDPTTLSALFTQESLLSLQGSAAAALLVPAVLGYLIGPRFQPYAKWASFGVAILLAYLVAALAADDGTWIKWLLAFFNAFLIFASAVGINEALAKSRGPVLASDERRPFFSWL